MKMCIRVFIRKDINSTIYLNCSLKKKYMQTVEGKKERQSERQVAFTEPLLPAGLDLKGFCR
jgi:hypothetical protein